MIFRKYPIFVSRFVRANSSAGPERLPYKQDVGGSNPSSPTDKALFFRAFFVFVHFDIYPNNISLHPRLFPISFSTRILSNMFRTFSGEDDLFSCLGLQQLLQTLLHERSIGFAAKLFHGKSHDFPHVFRTLRSGLLNNHFQSIDYFLFCQLLRQI